MTYEEKLDLILGALVEARKATRKNQSTKLYISADRGLNIIGKDELREIVMKLQQEEGIFRLNEIYNRLLSQSEQPNDLPYILVDIKPSFDSWYSNYLIQKRARLENLTDGNFQEIYSVLLQIEEQLQLKRAESFNFSFVSSFQEVEGYDIEDIHDLASGYLKVLDYLKSIGGVMEYSRADNSLDADIVLNISNFYDILDRAKKIHFVLKKDGVKDGNKVKDVPQKEVTKNTGEKDELVYQITYTKQRQVLMNNAQISKPDFNSENDLVFSFIYENPNKRITREEIEKAICGKLTKSLHKIVENLGFEGDTKQVFFSVSKNAIEFRNPITKKTLGEMKTPFIKLVKGGGKLVIPR